VKHVYAPWRISYLMSGEKPECLFCDLAAVDDDRRDFILHRGENWYVILNRYPYTTGHVMVVSNRHVEAIGELAPEEASELVALLARCERAVASAYRPDAINVGANLGRSAGAGIVGHLHMHLVPRWHGDTNFMTSIAETRVVSEGLDETYERLLSALDAD
jgi:ATP adenylyltransferase